MIGLGTLPGHSAAATAFGVSADGSVIVGTSSNYGPEERHEAFIYEAQHGMRSLSEVLESDFGLNLSGWRLLWAYDVSGDGRTIVGWGNNPDVGNEGWVAHIPEPGTPALLIATLALVAARWRSPRVCNHR